jgi:uncharacterized protein with PIN domain
MTALIFTNPDLPPDVAQAKTRCPECGQHVELVTADGVLRVAAHDYPAFGGLAGACPAAGRGLGRVGRQEAHNG